MADKKISALTAAATPLDGTEVLPIVQSGATVKVANNDLRPKQIQSNATSGVLQVVGPAAAATRVATVPDANFTVARTDAAQSFTGDQTLSTGNLIIGTSGKGIDFSATPGTGTSELLADYEEGTWTPTHSGFNAVGAVTVSGTYLKIGRNVWLRAEISAATSMAPVYNGGSRLQSLPFSGLQGVATWSVNNAATVVTTTYHDGTGNIYAPTANVGAGIQMIMNMFYQT